MIRLKLLLFWFPVLAFLKINAGNPIYTTPEYSKLADGTGFAFWEKEQHPLKTYHVACKNENASDENPGTLEAPFKTIGAAAKILEPGQKVIIHEGIYREKVVPQFGGESPEKMICYEASPGEEVIISGCVEVDPEYFKPSKGWYFKTKNSPNPNVWQIDLNPDWFKGYNPFGMMNILHDLEWLDYKRANMESHFKRRGHIYMNGRSLPQVATPAQLAKTDAPAFWIEHNGMRLHVKLPDNIEPKDYQWEITNQEQVFAPEEYGLGFIKISGITFQRAANGFPVPQRGMVSANRGHHWIIENCIIEDANSVGADLGNESWDTEYPEIFANHVVRNNIIRNCGISGLQCYIAKNMLVEDNLFQNIGWQNAEHAFESAGMKFHQAENSLIRRNVFSDIKYAPGLWLDYQSTKNCRITGNLFHDITTARGAIYIEVSHQPCLVDHNVIIGTRCQSWLSGEYGAGGSGLYTDGSDNINFCYNLIIDTENTGYGAYLNAPRIVGSRGGITINHSLSHNLFVDCRKHCIEFPHERHFSDNNMFSSPKPGYIKIGYPNSPLLLDKEAAQTLYDWEKHSVASKPLEYSFDKDSGILVLNLHDDIDFQAGPYKLVKGENRIMVNPRKQ